MSKKVTRLARRVIHKENEGAFSLLARLAYRNGYKDLGLFARRVGLTNKSVLGNCLPRLSALSSVPVEHLAQWTPTADGMHFFWKDNRFPINYYISLQRRICPECFTQDRSLRGKGERETDAAYLRHTWRFQPMTGCIIHGIQLVDKCPKCENELDNNSLPIDHCRCGYDLANSPAGKLIPSELEFLRWLDGRLNGKNYQPNRYVILDSMPLVDAINSLAFLGSLSNIENKKRRSPRNTSSVPTVVLGSGLHIVAGLPASFKYILELRETNDGPIKNIKSWYGNYFLLRLRKVDPLSRQLKSIFDSHVAPRIQRKIVTPEQREQQRASVKRMQMRLGVDELARLESVFHWEGERPPRRSDVKKKLIPLRLLMSAEVAKSHLSINWSQMMELVSDGTLRPCWPAVTQSPLYFYRADLDDWLDGLLNSVKTVQEIPENLISLKSVSQSSRISIRRLLGRIRDGELHVCARLHNAVGVDQILMSKNNAPSRYDAPLDYTRVNDVLEILSITRPTATAILQKNLMKYHTFGRAQFVETSEVTKFRNCYVSLPELARETGFNYLLLRRELAHLNLMSDSRHTRIYERAAVSHWMESKLVPQASRRLPR